MGFAPGANGSPRFRPSGVEPVFLPNKKGTLSLAVLDEVELVESQE